MTTPLISVSNLSIGYDNNVLMKNMSFDINSGDVFAVMGPSGCGKSTLLRVMTGLIAPLSGTISVGGRDFTGDECARRDIMRNIGILYQGGALFSSMTVSENIELPLRQYTGYSDSMIRDIVEMKLALVGLPGIGDLYPSQLSGGMKKRAGLARALALDAQIVYFDEPSAGLDPIASRQLDDLILEINRAMGTTIILVSHELESIFTVANNSIFLDTARHEISGRGKPNDLRRNPPNATIRQFLTRGKTNEKSAE